MRRHVGLVWIAALAACADAGGEPAASVVLPWSADIAGAVRIGVLEGNGPEVFGAVGGVVVAEDGRIFVGDDQAKEVRIFSASGDFLVRFGREGAGPGEFQAIGGLGRAPGGGIAVLDGEQNLVSIIDAAGTFVRATRLARPYRVLNRGALVRVSGDGSVHDVAPLSAQMGPREDGIIRYTPEGVPADTVRLPPFEPWEIVVTREGLPIMSFTIPEAPAQVIAVGPDGSAYIAMSDAYAITRLAPDGDTIGVIRREVIPTPIPTPVRDSIRAAVIERYTDTAGTPPREIPELPRYEALIVAMQVDEKGYLWVRRDRTSWDVFDPAGAFRGSIDLPAMWVMHIGERTVAGVTTDDLGVQRVVVIPIEGRAL